MTTISTFSPFSQNLNDSNFQLRASFRERMEALKGMRSRVLQQNLNKPSVVICGGGPGGLCRAINALINGNPTTVIEKRAESDNGRENAVALRQESIHFLCYCGIYQYLLEKGSIYPFKGDSLNVRLKDLEQAMKAVIAELTHEQIIHYDSQLEQIVRHPNAKTDLIVRNNAGRQTRLNAVDLMVVAEGAHGRTNEQLLHNRRIAALPSIPVIAAIFKDDRPSINSIPTFFQYVGKSVAHTATSVYYYAILLFKSLFQGEHIFNNQRRIAGSLILPTPGQNYLGCGLSKEETETLIKVCNTLKESKAALETAQRQGISPNQLVPLQQKVERAQKERDAYLNYWTGLSFCFANMLSLFRFIFGGNQWQFSSWLPLDHASIAEIGADKSSAYSGTIERTHYLIAGDTMATVDPTTGLGCNTAIKSTQDFHHFLIGLDRNENIQVLLDDYNRCSESVVSYNHQQSTNMRFLYRPDALLPPREFSLA
jgi:hypothetical protein